MVSSTPYVWMFNFRAYEKIAELLVYRTTVGNMIQFEYSAFEESNCSRTVLLLFRIAMYRKKDAICVWLGTSVGAYGKVSAPENTGSNRKNHDCGFYY